MSADTENLKIAETDTKSDISANTETDNFRSLIGNVIPIWYQLSSPPCLDVLNWQVFHS